MRGLFKCSSRPSQTAIPELRVACCVHFDPWAMLLLKMSPPAKGRSGPRKGAFFLLIGGCDRKRSLVQELDADQTLDSPCGEGAIMSTVTYLRLLKICILCSILSSAWRYTIIQCGCDILIFRCRTACMCVCVCFDACVGEVRHRQNELLLPAVQDTDNILL